MSSLAVSVLSCTQTHVRTNFASEPPGLAVPCGGVQQQRRLRPECEGVREGDKSHHHHNDPHPALPPPPPGQLAAMSLFLFILYNDLIVGVNVRSVEGWMLTCRTTATASWRRLTRCRRRVVLLSSLYYNGKKLKLHKESVFTDKQKNDGNMYY